MPGWVVTLESCWHGPSRRLYIPQNLVVSHTVRLALAEAYLSLSLSNPRTLSRSGSPGLSRATCDSHLSSAFAIIATRRALPCFTLPYASLRSRPLTHRHHIACQQERARADASSSRHTQQQGGTGRTAPLATHPPTLPLHPQLPRSARPRFKSRGSAPGPP